MKAPVYIAGPMQGYPQFNFPAFDEAAAYLYAQGIELVVNPAQLDRDAGFDPDRDPVTPEFIQKAIDRDLEALKSCKSIVMLDGWRNSTGAKAEHALAKWLGLDIYEMSELRPEYEHKLPIDIGDMVSDIWTKTAEQMDEAETEPKTIGYILGPNEFVDAPRPLPTDAAERKKIPVYSGFVHYFPLAIIAVAKKSQEGNDQHNPGAPVHWDRTKSGDELDALMRHIIDREWDSVAWRAMANLEKQEEKRLGITP